MKKKKERKKERNKERKIEKKKKASCKKIIFPWEGEFR
jgi:hypothetical protein